MTSNSGASAVAETCSHPSGQAQGLGASRIDQARDDGTPSPTHSMYEASVLEALIDDATQVIQRTPYLLRYRSDLWTDGLISEFADAVDRLSCKVAELQGAGR